MNVNKEIDKKRFDEVIKAKNDEKLDIWYSLKDLVELKGISYRSLKNMVKDVYEKHSDQGSIYKKGRRYFIKYTLLDAFELKQPRKYTVYSYPWKSNISYTTLDRYDFEYHQQIVNEITGATPEVNYVYATELDKSERNHVHLMADYEPKYIKPIINRILEKYLDSTQNYRLYCEPVQNKACSINYLIKNPKKDEKN